ncbi:hypothetical protein [Streptomyces tubercidicus]|uniref:hypothetical protein n=1 Tax=Streptomyces tubercidicus TaxID=47759 RepID=UPI00369730D5
MKVDLVRLWRYEESRESTDCDGSHASHKEYLDHRSPSAIVYSKADLFAVDGPSGAILEEGSDQNEGSASIGHGTDEGSVGWHIRWTRVTDKVDLDSYIQEIENGKMGIFDFQVDELYRARVRAHVRHHYPEATGIAVNPATAEGESWEITAVYGSEAWGKPKALWEGKADEVSLSVASVKEISHDLEVLYATEHIEADSYVRLS